MAQRERACAWVAQARLGRAAGTTGQRRATHSEPGRWRSRKKGLRAQSQAQTLAVLLSADADPNSYKNIAISLQETKRLVELQSYLQTAVNRVLGRAGVSPSGSLTCSSSAVKSDTQIPVCASEQLSGHCSFRENIPRISGSNPLIRRPRYVSHSP